MQRRTHFWIDLVMYMPRRAHFLTYMGMYMPRWAHFWTNLVCRCREGRTFEPTWFVHAEADALLNLPGFYMPRQTQLWTYLICTCRDVRNWTYLICTCRDVRMFEPTWFVHAETDALLNLPGLYMPRRTHFWTYLVLYMPRRAHFWTYLVCTCRDGRTFESDSTDSVTACLFEWRSRCSLDKERLVFLQTWDTVGKTSTM